MWEIFGGRHAKRISGKYAISLGLVVTYTIYVHIYDKNTYIIHTHTNTKLCYVSLYMRACV